MDITSVKVPNIAFPSRKRGDRNFSKEKKHLNTHKNT